jgi:hypothetical protein
MDIKKNIQLYLQDDDKNEGVRPEERYASFDYCYNYFQSFREMGCPESLAASQNMQQSCLQIGFYLASWGMLRGSTFLLQKSAQFYEPLIECIAGMETPIWEIDVDSYTEDTIEILLDCERRIVQSLSEGGRVSATLVTKIMLGVYGNVPAFDDRFVRGFGLRWSVKALRCIASFYEENRAVIDSFEIATLDFASRQKTHRKYPKAKIIDMIGFIEGRVLKSK